MGSWTATDGIPVLRAVLDRIIPADEDPGALELGTEGYVLAQLAGSPSDRDELVANGLRTLDADARSRFSCGFPALAADLQDNLLAERQNVAWFVLLAELAAEGFYADPANGGNRDARSWTMIGYEHRLPDGPSGRIDAGPGSSASGRWERR